MSQIHPVLNKALGITPIRCPSHKQHAWFLFFLMPHNQCTGKSCWLCYQHMSLFQPLPTSSTVNHLSLNHFLAHLGQYNSILIPLTASALGTFPKTLNLAATVIPPKCNSDHFILLSVNSLLCPHHSVKPNSCDLALTPPPLQPLILLLSASFILFLSCCPAVLQTGLACLRTLSFLFLLTRAQPYNLCSLILLFYSDLYQLSLSQRGFPLPNLEHHFPAVSILSALTLLDFSS